MTGTNLAPSFERERVKQLRKEAKKKWSMETIFKIVIFSGLFFGIYVAFFNLVNLNTDPKQKLSDRTPVVQSSSLSDEFKKRLGSTTFSVESYDDWGKRFGLGDKDNGLDADPDGEGLPNYLEYIHGTNPLKADSDGDKFTDKQELANGYDPDAPGDTKPGVLVQIEKVGVAAPMVWSLNETEKTMLKDLENGLSHFPKSAAPGQNGNAVISGHSSNYAWAKGNFNHVFEKLDNMEKGDRISITTIQKNGRVVNYHYIVSDKFVTIPDDVEIFAETTMPSLTLSTCWPIGTNLKRLIVKAELEK